MSTKINHLSKESSPSGSFSRSTRQIDSRAGGVLGTGKATRTRIGKTTINPGSKLPEAGNLPARGSEYSNNRSGVKRSERTASLFIETKAISFGERATIDPGIVTSLPGRLSMQSRSVFSECHLPKRSNASSREINLPFLHPDVLATVAYLYGRIDEATQAEDQQAISRCQYRQPSPESLAKSDAPGRSYTTRRVKTRGLS
jgi:hypothetical protein